MVEDRDQEAFGLARSGAGGDDRRLGRAVTGAEAFERTGLVSVRLEVRRLPVQWRTPVSVDRTERRANADVGAAEDPVVRVEQEVLECLPGLLVGQRECVARYSMTARLVSSASNDGDTTVSFSLTLSAATAITACQRRFRLAKPGPPRYVSW